MRLSAGLGRALAIACLVLLYPILSPLFHGGLPGLQAAGIVVGLCAFAAIYAGFWLRLTGSNDWRIITIVCGLLLGLGLLLNSLSGVWTINPFVPALLVAGYAYRLPLSIAAVAGITAFSMAAVLPALIALRYSVADIIVVDVIFAIQLLIFGLVAIGAAWLVRTVQQLQAAREQLALLAVEQERARFARDVHDLMGHSLSVITLKGELAQQLIERSPEQARAEIQDIVRVARNALREVREAVTGYRQPTLANELAGARAALAAAGIECTVDQAAGALTREAEAVLAWTVREGVTNVLRHSKAARCSIVLTRDDDAVRLDVVDDGAGAQNPEAGNGLRGLGERVREQGGRLEAGPLSHQGFRLRVVVPTGSASAPASEPSRAADLNP